MLCGHVMGTSVCQAGDGRAMGQKNTPWEEAAQLLGTWGGMGMLSQASWVPALGGNWHSEPSASTVRQKPRVGPGPCHQTGTEPVANPG